MLLNTTQSRLSKLEKGSQALRDVVELRHIAAKLGIPPERLGVLPDRSGDARPHADTVSLDPGPARDSQERWRAVRAIWSLERLLRTAELSGHDPDRVLADAIAARDFTGAHSLAQVTYARITHALEGQLTPYLTSATDLIPRDAAPDYRAWLARRAEAADERRHELGTETAEQAPAWALDALGPVPEDVVERQEWEHRAGWAAAWRELAGHTDEHDPLGAAPPRGQVEKAALFRAAHEALRLLDAGHEEAGMTDGRLRMRVHALKQEEAWARRHVDEELAATHAAADRACADATVWAARAEAPDISDVDREQLRTAAAGAQRQAEELAQQVAALEEATWPAPGGSSRPPSPAISPTAPAPSCTPAASTPTTPATV